MTRTYVIISDTHLPCEDKRAVKALIRFIAEYQPDEVVHIGDLMDYPQPSRWSKGTAAEFEGSVYRDSEYAKRALLEPLRAVYDGPVGVIEGNHDLRPREYLKRYAPALADSGAFNFENLLDFGSFDIKHLPDFYDFAPGWVMAHGHLGQLSLSRIAGNTALNGAKRFGKSLIMGHTHRLGVGSHTTGYDAKVVKTVTGLEVGNLMDMKSAHYLKGGTANWQQGFGLVEVSSKHVSAQRIAISSGRFIVHGAVYEL